MFLLIGCYSIEVSGCIIQVPTLERGDRLVIEEPAQHLPLTIPVTYLIEGTNKEAETVRYVNMEELPKDLKRLCEKFIRSRSD